MSAEDSAFFGLLRSRTRRAKVAERRRTARRLIPVHSLRVCGLGVLREVDTGRLVLGADPEAHEPVDHLGQHVRHDERVRADYQCPQRLLAELSESAAIEEALRTASHHFGGQQSDQQHTNDPTDEVHTDHIE
jgi:hypothetical protein